MDNNEILNELVSKLIDIYKNITQLQNNFFIDTSNIKLLHDNINVLSLNLKNPISLNEYVSEFTDKNDYFRIELSGNDPTEHNVLTPYNDAGLKAYNYLDTELIVEVTSNTVEISNIGSYEIIYTIKGNQKTYGTRTRIVNVVDLVSPVITINGDVSMTFEVFSAFNVNDFSATAVDAYFGYVPIIVSYDPPDLCLNIIGQYKIIYSATDSCGNDASAVQIINVIDTTIPVITLIDSSYIIHEIYTSFTDPGVTVTDNYDSSLSLTSADVVVTGTVDINNIGLYTLTYTVTDSNNNNSETVTRTVEVKDQTLPVITISGDISMTLEVFSAFTDPGVTVTDNYDTSLLLTSAHVVVTGTVDISSVGVYTLAYNVTDSCGNQALTKYRYVTIEDTTIPVITLIDNSYIIHEVHTSFTDPGVTVTDNYDSSSSLTSADVVVTGTVDINTIGLYTLTYTVTDSNNNNSETVTRTVEVKDQTLPVITISGDISMTLEVFSAFTDPGVTVTDNYDTSLSLTSAHVVVTGTVDISSVGVYTLAYNVTDSCGNQALTKYRYVTIEDTTIPVITLIDSSYIIHEVYTSFIDPGVTVTDNYDSSSSLTSVDVVVTGTVDINTIGLYTLTYIVIDSNNNNSETVTRTVEVKDSTLPVITISGDISMTLEVFSSFTDPGVTVTDNYDTSLSLTSAHVVVTGTVDISLVGVYTLVYNVTDSCGNQALTKYRYVTIEDTTLPTASLIGENPLIWNINQTYIDPGINASDNYDVSLTITTSSTIDISVVGLYSYIYNVNDDYDNSINITRQVYVLDFTAIQNVPSIDISNDSSNNITNILQLSESTIYTPNNELLLSDDFVVNLNDTNYYHIPLSVLKNMYDGPNNVLVLVYGYDNETIKIINTISNETYEYPYVSNELILKKEVNLILDNSSNCKLLILDGRHSTLLDNRNPTLELSGNNPFNLLVNNAFNDPGITLARDYKNNDISDMIVTHTDLAIDIVGTYQKLYIATDASGYQTIKSRNIAVYDDVIPVITLIDSSYIIHEIYTSFIDPGVTVTDNYDLNIQLVAQNNVNINKVGIYQIIYNATDSNGNKSIPVTRIVEIKDTTNPLIILTQVNGSIDISWDVYNPFIDPGYDVSDNYDISLSYVDVVVTGIVDISLLGLYTLTYSVTDSCGNDASAVRIITIVDREPPVLTLIGNTNVYHIINTSYVDQSANIIDNYFAANLITLDVSNNVDINTVGTYTVIYNAVDPCGNHAIPKERIVNVYLPPPVTNLINTIIDYQIPKYYSLINNIVYPQPENYYKAYCVPTSFASVLNYYSEVQGLNIQINYTSINSVQPETDYLYNYNGRPMSITGITDPLKIDLGYMLNTNAQGYDISNGLYKGTILGHFEGFKTFMDIISPNTLYNFYYKGLNNDVSYTNISGATGSHYSQTEINNGTIFTAIKTNIDTLNPIILSFRHWNIIHNSYTNVNGNQIEIYDWSGYTPIPESSLTIYSTNPEFIDETWNNENGETNLGHTVVCVGYLENYNNKNWLIVQDNILQPLPFDPAMTHRFIAVELDYTQLIMCTFIDFTPQGGLPINNLTVSSNIPVYDVDNQDNPDNLPAGFTSSLRLYDTAIIDISQQFIINTTINLNDNSNNIAIYTINNGLYIECASGNLYNGEKILSVFFDICNNNIKQTPLTDISFILSDELSDIYNIYNTIEQKNYFWIETIAANYNDSEFIDISTSPILLGTFS